jgi:hypothetical protein
MLGYDQENTGGILGSLGRGLSANSGMLLGYGLGGAQGMMQGQQNDRLAAKMRMEQAEKQKQSAQTQLALKSLGGDKFKDVDDPQVAQMILSQLNNDRTYQLQQQTANKPQLIGSAETGYTWATPGGSLPEQFTKPQSGFKATDDMREYQFDMQQRAAQGGQVIPFGEWMQQTKKTNTTINNIPAQIEKEEEKLRAQGAAKYLNDIAGQSGAVAQRSADLNTLGSIISKTPTGSSTELRAQLDGIGKSLGLSDGTLKTQADAIKAITNRIAPTLRAPGSGSQSDAELAGFLSALPNLSATPGGNQIIQGTLQRAAAIDREKSRIAAQYQTGRLSASEARAKVAEIEERSIFGSDEERKIIENLMGGAPLSGNATEQKGWGVIGVRER